MPFACLGIGESNTAVVDARHGLGREHVCHGRPDGMRGLEGSDLHQDFFGKVAEQVGYGFLILDATWGMGAVRTNLIITV